MTTVAERLEAATVKAEAASEIARQWANGPTNSTVTTESGPLPTLAEFMRQNSASITVATAFPAELAAANSTKQVGGAKAGDIAKSVITVPKLKNLAALTVIDIKVHVISVYDDWASTALCMPYGGGDFYYNATLPKSKHNGGTIIAPEALNAWDGTAANIATLFNWTGAGTGCFVRASGRIDATTWFADPNGVNESSACLSAYAKSMTYGTMNLPRGTFKVSQPVQNLNSKINIHGAGSNVSFIHTYLAEGQRALSFSGTAASTNAHTSYRGFAIIAQNATGTGIHAVDAAYCLFDDIYTENFALHWELDSVLTSLFSKVVSRFGPANAIGVLAENSGSSNPNALTFISSVFSSLATAGLIIRNVSRLSYIGGSVEACGSGIDGAFLIESGGGQGPAGAYIQTYFEGNGGIADLWIKQYGTNPFTVDVANSTFNRLPSPRYATNCIRMTQSAGSAFSSLRVGSGCAFRGFDTYTPNASRRYVYVDSATNNYKFVDDGSNYYDSSVEAPDVPVPPLTFGATIAVDLKRYADDDYVPLVITSGASFQISNPTNAVGNKKLKLFIRNNFGAAGTLTFGSEYKPASTLTPPILNQGAVIEFALVAGGIWIETSRTTGIQLV